MDERVIRGRLDGVAILVRPFDNDGSTLLLMEEAVAGSLDAASEGVQQ